MTWFYLPCQHGYCVCQCYFRVQETKTTMHYITGGTHRLAELLVQEERLTTSGVGTGEQ